MRALLLVGAVALAGCATQGPAGPQIQTSNAVIAVVGFDDALKERFSKKIPKGEDGAELELFFQQDVAADGCVDGGADPSKKLPPMARFQQSGTLDILMGDGKPARVRLFNANDLGAQSGDRNRVSWRITPGNYALRDVEVTWGEHVGPLPTASGMALATSSKYSAAFRTDGGPTFIGLYRIGLTAQDEVVLTEMETPDTVAKAAAQQLGLSGSFSPHAVTEVRELKRCGSTGGIRLSKTPVLN